MCVVCVMLSVHVRVCIYYSCTKDKTEAGVYVFVHYQEILQKLTILLPYHKRLYEQICCLCMQSRFG